MPDGTNDLRRNWRKLWLECIHEFSRIDLQQACWLGQSGTMSSFVECMSSYFNDLHLDSGYAGVLSAGLVSPDEVQLLAELHALAAQYEPPPNYDHQQIILADPRWHAVVGAAQRAWRGLKTTLTDPADQAVFRLLDSQTCDSVLGS